jgi:hypothetical protein
MRPVHRWLLLVALWALAGCAETAAGGAAAVTGPGTRTGPDDSDLWNLAPADADALADLDLAALRASPWSSALMTGDLGGEREQRRRAFGYDIFTEADRMVVVAAERGGVSHALSIARGAFDAGRIGAAFTGATPGAVEGRWRESPLWEGGGRAVALVTPRTLAEGDPESVRGAIDAAWGIVPDARGGGLGELRAALDADQGRPAVFLGVSVGEPMRARAAGFIDVPPELRRVAARMDLAADLDVDGLALFEGERAAAAAAAEWGQAARQLGRQPMVLLLGLSPVFEGLSMSATGPRVRAHLHIAASRRGGLAQKLEALLQLMAKTRGGGGGG